MRFFIAFVLALILSLPAQAYTPYPISSYSAKQSANFAGLSSMSSTHPTIVQGTPNWITDVTRTSAGNYTFTLASLAFTSTPLCVGTTGGGNFIIAALGCTTSTACSMETRIIGGADADPSTLSMICTGGR